MASTVSRLYGDFRGVDLRGEECSLQRSPDSLNMWRDYRKETGICTRPTFEGLLGLTNRGRINSLSFYKGYLMVNAGNSVLYCDVTDVNNITVASLDTKKFMDTPSKCFVFDGIWYIKNEVQFWAWDKEKGHFGPVDPYVPTTSIARTPAGDGENHEDVNILTRQRKNTFVSDGKSTEYFLDAKNLISVLAVRINGVLQDDNSFSVNMEEGKVIFKEPPVVSPDGEANVEITFGAGEYQANKISECTIVQIFDNRVFFGGNPEYPNVVWHSSVNDPTYVSDRDYYEDGRDEAAVRALVAGNDALWVFREPSDENTTVFYHRPTLDENYGKIYPAVHSSISTGCVGAAVNFNDDIVFFSDRGMEGVSADITTEQAISHRSSMVDREMTKATGYKDMVLAEWEGYLLVIIGTTAYLADSRGRFENEGHMEYEWFKWELKHDGAVEMGKVTCAAAHNGVLYLGDETGQVWCLRGKGSITSYWTTPKDKFKNPNRLKTTNKRGCVVEATGDVAVYAKTEGTKFEQIADEKGVTDYFVPRIKQKKFKDIQLKFQSATGFSLDSVTLECFIGGYIKR